MRLLFFFLVGLLAGSDSLSAQTVQRVGPIKVNASNALQWRDSLINRVFGTRQFPYHWMPDSLITNVRTIDHLTTFPYRNLYYPAGNLDSIDKMVVTIASDPIDFPAKAKVYVFRPHQSNGKLFIYHAGHCAGVASAEDVFVNGSVGVSGQLIPQMIQRGYTVLAVPMPYYRASPPNGYRCGFNKHDQIFTDNRYAYPLSLFFRPLIASLNKLGRSSFSEIYMVGLSGGGWATSVYPAMDSSIRVSVPIAGSWPMALRNMYYPNGDYEQYYPPVFQQLLDYHELYTLSCLAPARRVLQINNRYDACCFNGRFQHVFYVDSVSRALRGSGGRFSFYLDETGSRHAISLRAAKVMFRFLENDTAWLSRFPADSIERGMNYYFDPVRSFTVDRVPRRSGVSMTMLQSPEWLYHNLSSGEISGYVSPSGLMPVADSISFKVEDTAGRFVIYNFKTVRKRDYPYFFTIYPDSAVLFGLPLYPYSLNGLPPDLSSHFRFNRSDLQIVSAFIVQGSVFRFVLNRPVRIGDSVSYTVGRSVQPIRYSSGLAMADFPMVPLQRDVWPKALALPGMIRFNTDTKKFEYFNGTFWRNMH